MEPAVGSNPRPLVSVVMIFFQAERFIAEAIASVLAQTYAEWELLLVDDGSTDAGSALARAAAERHPDRIRYLRHPDGGNHGMAASRNLGMARARGELIAFLDADDVYLPERLARHVELLVRLGGPGVAISSEVYWHSWDPAAREPDRVVTIGVAPLVAFAPPRLLRLMLTQGLAASPGICSVTFHRLELDGLSGAPEAFVGHYEDQCLYDALLAERRAIVTDEPLAKYRQHRGSYTAHAAAAGLAAEGRGNEAERRFLEWLREHLRARGVLAPSIADAIALRLAPHAAVDAAPRAWRARVVRVASAAFRATCRLLPPAGERALRALVAATRERLRRRRIARVERARC